MGDFNGDGNQDLAVTIYGSGAIEILLGKGDGTFTLTTAGPAVGAQVTQIAVGDFNGDGIPDLAMVNDSTSAGVNILLGNGDGTFAAKSTNPPTANNTSYFAIGDFNGDGKLDLAVTDSSDDVVTILLGNGDGTFSLGNIVHCGSNNSPIVAGDFNGDGNLDLAVGFGGAYASNDGATVLTGNGSGGFTSPSSGLITNNTATSIQIGDFNRDGFPDVAMTDSNGNILVLLNNQSGVFTENFLVETISPPYYMVAAVGDLNGDGYSDIVAGGYYLNTSSVFLTQPTETATASTNVSLPAGMHQVEASYGGDSNYNASVSGATALWGEPSATSTSLAVTSGGGVVTSVAPGSVVSLTAAVTTETGPLASGQVNFCDATASHCTDVHLLGTTQLSTSGTATYRFVPGPGAHSYKAVYVESGWGLSSSSNIAPLTVGPAPNPVYSDVTSIALAGSPGDYSLTATLEGFGGSAPLTGNISFVDTSFGNTKLATVPISTTTAGLGWLISQTAALSNNTIAEVTGDFNGDGIPDVAIVSGTSDNPGAVTVLFGKGDGTFTTGPTSQTGLANQYSAYMIAGDFNGDGKTDLAILGWPFGGNADYVTVLVGNGDGTFAAPLTTQVFNQGVVGGDGIPGSVVAADFNGDGKLDLAVVGDYVNTGGMTVLLGNGDGTFNVKGSNYAPNSGFNVIATGDFNGDGIPDLVTANYFAPGGATVFLGKGDGSFTTMPTPLAVSEFPRSIVVGDFNGDGIADLAFGYNGAVVVFLGNGDGTFSGLPGGPIAGAGICLVAGDFNHDGKLDLAGIDNYNDQIDLFLGNGDGTFTETITTPNVSQSVPGPFAIAAADFNGDGIPDLAMLTPNVNTASILLTEPTQIATVTANNIAPVGAGTHNVDASYSGDSNYSASVSSSVALTAGLAPLVITPASGTYTSPQTLTITESVPGSTIYYSMIGSPLNTNGFVPYTGPISLSEGGTEYIQAYATETGYQASNLVQASYVLDFPSAATPTISLAPGYYSGPQSVTITDTDTTASIYYTTNGTLPSTSSNLYSGPITVSSTETLVAVAISVGHSYSLPATAQYVIGGSSVPMIYTVAGTGLVGYTGDGGPATQAQIHAPYAMVKDASGNLYFSDQGNHMVRKVAAGTGIISVVAGNGYSGYTGDGGQASSAELSYPTGLALDKLGNLFIADGGAATVREVNLSSGIITTYAGNPNATSPGDGGPATAAALGYINAIAMDASQNLYIASYSTIRQVNSGTGIITTIAGNGLYGYGGDGGPASNAQFYEIYGLAFDAAGNLYVADTANNIIRKIAAVNSLISTSSIVTTVAGTPPRNGAQSSGYSGDGGPATSAKLNDPVAVALDSSGDLFISDSNNNVIREVTASNGLINSVAGNGICDTLGGDGTAATAASLCYPLGITVDGSGNLFVADQTDRIREIAMSSNTPTTQAAAPTLSLAAGTYANAQTVTITDTTPGASIYVTVDGTTPTTGGAHGYSLPINVTGVVTVKAIATAPGYVTSNAVSATYKVSAFSPVITTVAGSGTAGFYGAGRPALQMLLGSPKGVALDKAGNLYISDATNGVVWVISASTGTASIFAGTGVWGYTGDGGPAVNAELSLPEGIAFDNAGNLYIADTFNNVIRKVTSSTGIISTVAGKQYPTYGQIGDGGPATSASLMNPTNIAFDAPGNLYIADTYNDRVREVSATTGIITTVAGNGTAAVSGDGGPATSAGLQPPDSLAIDQSGNIYVASSYGARIRKITSSTGQINTIAGFEDVPGETGDGGPASIAEIMPRGLTLDSTGNLYVSGIGEIREISTSTGVISKVAGIGYPGYSGDGGAAAAAEIFYPNQIAFDAAGNLYYADGMDRVRKVTFAEQTAPSPVFSVPSGTYTSGQSVTISDTVPGTTIYYTTDGSTPMTSSTIFTTPLVVNSSETIRAIATATDYSQSSVAAVAYVINLRTPSVTLSPASSSISTSQSLGVTISVGGGAGNSTPTGGVTISSGAYTSAPAPLANGIASITVPAGSLPTGTNILMATYVPDAASSISYDAASGTASITVTNPSYSMAATSATVAPGGSTTSIVTISSNNGYAGTVSVACSISASPSGALDIPTCAASQSVTLSSSTTSGTATITVNSTAASSALMRPRVRSGAGWEAGESVALALVVIPLYTRRRRKALSLLVFTTVLILLSGMSACGGSGSKTPPPSNPGTTPGNYTVTVTAVGNDAAKTAASTIFTLTVN